MDEQRQLESPRAARKRKPVRKRSRAGQPDDDREHSRSRSHTNVADMFDTIKHTLAKMVFEDEEDELFVGPEVDDTFVEATKTLLHPFARSAPQSRQSRTRSAGEIMLQHRESQVTLMSVSPAPPLMGRQRSQSHDFAKSAPAGTRVSLDELRKSAGTPPPPKMHTVPEENNKASTPPPILLVKQDSEPSERQPTASSETSLPTKSTTPKPNPAFVVNVSDTSDVVQLHDAHQRVATDTFEEHDSADDSEEYDLEPDHPTFRPRPMKRSLSTKTRLLQDWHSHEKHQGVSWYELFTDLTFVAIIIKMANNVKFLWKKGKHSKWQILAEILLVHASFFTVWLEFTTVFTRFISSSWQVQLMHYGYMAGLVTMALNVHEAALMSSNFTGFASGMCVCVFLLILIHLHFVHIPRAKNYCVLQMTEKVIALIILFTSIFVPKPISLIMMAFSVSGLFVGTLMTFRVRTANIPVNVHHFAERFGLLIMLYIGESELAVILPDLNLDATHYLLAHLSFASVYVLRIIYFELAAHISDELHVAHALRNRGHPGALAFVFIHGLMSFALLCQAIGIKFMFAHLEDPKKKNKKLGIAEGLFLSLSVVIVQLSMVFARYTHQGINPQWVYLVLRFILLALCFSLPWYARNPIYMMIGIFAISCAFLFVDVFAIQLEIDDTQLVDFGAERRRKSKIKNPDVAAEHEHHHGLADNAFMEIKHTVTEARRSARLSQLPGLGEFQQGLGHDHVHHH